MNKTSESENPLMSRIHVLPDALSNQIAAGEVVERPCSVVKELVENAVDAGARKILIEAEQGGKELIRVDDDGCGMSMEDAELSFERHATSKISSQEDLVRIGTFGFRGEALPSIGSVAKVRLTTSLDENQGGQLVSVEAGEMKMSKQVGRPRGTQVEVRHLFFNTPARRKFLKSDSAEFSHIVQVATQQALAHPEIHFTLIHNGRQILNTASTDQLLYRIAELFGSELAGELVSVDSEVGDYRLTGFISSPVFTRSNRNNQYVYVNGRLVRDKVVQHATQQGYSHLLPKGRHPVIFLFLEMDPALVDVNVHPAKAEVRFAFQSDVHRFVSRAVRDALSSSDKLPLAEPVTNSVAGSPYSPPPTHRVESHHDRPSAQRTMEWKREEPSPRENQEALSRSLRALYQSDGSETHGSVSAGGMTLFEKKGIPLSKLIYSEFEPIGQLENSFIIMQGKKGMVIVDQHIAHERVLYERFREAARDKRLSRNNCFFQRRWSFLRWKPRF